MDIFSGTPQSDLIRCFELLNFIISDVAQFLGGKAGKP